jgi:hypothetical protein
MATQIGAILILSLGLGSFSYADSGKLIGSSGKARVPLVELYTSESCSSCPPADAWISKLQERTGLWKSFVPIAFHVDYWNKIGWKDGFSSDKMTKRQVDLTNLWSEPSVYTPGVIVDGKEWREWRNSGRSFPSAPSTAIELLVIKNSDGSLRIKGSGLAANKRYVVRVALLGMDLSTNVTSGENSGHLLKHNFLVLDWDGKPLSSKSPELSFSFKTAKQKTSRQAIAAWIEEEGSPVPLQSTGGYL